MSKYCQACIDNRVYLEVVATCPNCGGALRPWEDGSVEVDRVTTEVHVQPDGLSPRPLERPSADTVPWLVGAFVILVLAAVLVRQPI